MPDIETQRKDGVLEMTLSRPERKNAVTIDMWGQMARVFTEAGTDPETRVVVVRGAGGNFCSGADLGGGASGAGTSTSPGDAGAGADGDGGDGRTGRSRDVEAETLEMLRGQIAPAAIALNRLRKPTIAMVEGIAAGAGCNLALGCDLVYAAEDARFSQIFVRRALSLDFGGAWLLPRIVGMQKAKELALFGDFISAPDALAAGMIAGVVPAAELDAHVRERARRLAEQAPIAMAAIKESLHAGLELSFADTIDREFALQVKCIVSEDFGEGVRAFVEKRKPHFSGR